MKTVCLATIWPSSPGDRAEDFILRELVSEYLSAPREWGLRVVVASAHEGALSVARGVMASFPAIPAEFWHLETPYAGTRAEEISFCKEELPRRLAETAGWEWLLFYDADVWTRLGQVTGWMGIIGEELDGCFVKIKYTLRDKLESPAHTLGAYFHHRAMLERLPYWTAIFPKNKDGKRIGAPDCNLHGYLERNKCRKVVPKGMQTLHFRNRWDAQGFDSDRCYTANSVRDEAGGWTDGRYPFAPKTRIFRIMPRGLVRSQRAVETHAGLDLTDVEAVTPAENSTRGREIACSQAHAKVMEQFLDSDADFAVVLEDDAILDADRAWMSIAEFDLLIPYAENRKHRAPSTTIRHGKLPEYGTFAYLCSRKFAAAFIPRLTAGGIADHALHRAAKALRVASFAGNLVNHDNQSNSLISEGRRLKFAGEPRKQVDIPRESVTRSEDYDEQRMPIFTRQQNDELYQLSCRTTEGFPRYAVKDAEGDAYIAGLLNQPAGWVCNMDEDVFLYSQTRLLELKNYMEANGFDYCGMRDGGALPIRFHNPSVCNPFFNLFATSMIAPKYSTFVAGEFMRADIAKHLEPDDFPSPFKYDMAESYYPHFLWLRTHFKCLFLDAVTHFDGISTVLNDHLGRPLLLHTWFARKYSPNDLRYSAAFSHAERELKDEMQSKSTVADRVLVGICSAHVHGKRRDAVRKTWLSHCTGRVEARFFVGGGSVSEPDTIVVDAPDDYKNLPIKVRAFFRYVLEHFEFEWLFKCDDDTYLVPERLLSLLGAHDVVGDRLLASRGSAQGGAGYLLSRNAVEFLATEDSLRQKGEEDIILTNALVRRGWSWKATDRLWRDARRVPQQRNDVVTCHEICPEKMLAIHTHFAGTPIEEINVVHPKWKDRVALYADGTFARCISPDFGNWKRDADKTLHLEWYDWKPEKFRQTESGSECPWVRFNPPEIGLSRGPIPRKIQFVWLGSELPSFFAGLVDACARLHPGWEIKVWGDDEVRQLIAGMGTGLDARFSEQRLSLSTKSDIARYHIIAREGGIYLDTDFLVWRTLEPLLEKSLFLAEQLGGVIATSVFGATPAHPLLLNVLEGLKRADFSQPPPISAGPEMFNCVCREWLSDSVANHILKPNTFFPVDFRKKASRAEWESCNIAESFAAHLWAHSWGRDGGDTTADLQARVDALKRRTSLGKNPMNISISHAQRLHLEVFGYVVIPGLVSEAELGFLRSEIADAKALSLQKTAPRPKLGGSSKPPHLLHVRSLVEDSPATVRHITNPALVAVAEDAIGTEARVVEVYAICNRRDPHAQAKGRSGFHRGADPVTGGYVREGRYHGNFIKALTYLTDVGPDDGGTTIIAGSHKLDWDMKQIIEAAMTTPSLIHTVVAKAGDTLIQFESVVHTTGIIRSDAERMVLIVGYAASLYPWWDVEPLSAEFLDALPKTDRALFAGRQSWERPAR